MPLLFVRQDITKIQADAVVNAANETLLGGGGVDGAIHRAAGPELLKECRTLGGCAVGEAKRTSAYRLPCRYVIHTVGPVWHGGTAGEREKLALCYANSLRIAADSDCESVAFPLISAGAYGYPVPQAVRVAVETIRAFLQTHEMTVYLVLFDRKAVDATRSRFGDVAQYIDEQYVEQTHKLFDRGRKMGNRPFWNRIKPLLKEPDDLHGNADAYYDYDYDSDSQIDKNYDLEDYDLFEEALPDEKPDLGLCDADSPDEAPLVAAEPRAPQPTQLWTVAERSDASLEDLLRQLDESFAQMLFRKIDERGITDAACYKKANIDRKLFSKIRSNPNYKPSKSTALAFAVALELPLNETRELLQKAGYALSHSQKFDLIIEYFIANGRYDVMEINEALFAFDQNLLGA